MLKAICFDLFSTLVDVGSVPLSVGNLTADILEVDHDVWRDACFSDDHDICQTTKHLDIIRKLAHRIDDSIPLEKIQAATVARQRRFDYALQSHIGGEVMQGLKQLRAMGYQLILISNASTAEVQAWQDSELGRFFDHAVFSCECGLKKPQMEIYRHAVKPFLLETHECIFVGDGGSDEFHGAAAVGMPVLMMTQYLSTQQQTQRMSHYGDAISATVGSVQDVVDWIVNNTADQAV